ncbi:hypothetical protein K438DRAFT_2128254 [Mycena galopus ATCC 62051]|nr:hypothetical protein K438DRAFT_2128254 [Mycena galopus ATCC 62051]
MCFPKKGHSARRAPWRLILRPAKEFPGVHELFQSRKRTKGTTLKKFQSRAPEYYGDGDEGEVLGWETKAAEEGEYMSIIYSLWHLRTATFSVSSTVSVAALVQRSTLGLSKGRGQSCPSATSTTAAVTRFASPVRLRSAGLFGLPPCTARVGTYAPA